MRPLTEQEYALLDAFHATHCGVFALRHKAAECERSLRALGVEPSRPGESWAEVTERYRTEFAALKLQEALGHAARYTSNGQPVGRPRTIPEAGPWVCRNGHAWADVTVATYGRGRRIHCRRCANIATVRSRRKLRQREAARRARHG